MTSQQESNAEFTGVGYWGSAATVYSSMANYDHFTGSTVYKTEVINGITTAFNEYSHFDQVSSESPTPRLPGSLTVYVVRIQ